MTDMATVRIPIPLRRFTNGAEEVSATGKNVGEIIEDKKLYVTHEDQKEVLFDFKSDRIMGIKEERS